ncbi:ROK family protein [Cohnella silvisoli]|uniref:ROK family protein n=1 Tax=Cohnella silvisoli TaxID=2873699 RepID=A0ABV1L0B1_9BACL|nr:ROK family protein [Cohnella silvisoli]MCD9025134.1 ROK family protein [Cohnella silvisoli]
MLNINQVKIQNRIRVFKEISTHDSTTRMDISRKVKLSVATISSIVEEFMKIGMIMEVKDNKSTIGRKPNMLIFQPDALKMICIDLTSKQFSFAVKNLALISEKVVVYEYDNELSYERNLHQFCKRIQQVIETEYKGQQLIGIGISVPGPYNQRKDRVMNKLILEIGEFSIHRFFSEQFPLPIQIDQDVNYAARAEVQHIEQYESKSVFFMYLGEGVGGAISINHNIYSGAQAFAGEIGQMIVIDGRNLEQLVSWKRLIAAARSHYAPAEATPEFLLARWSEKDEWLLKEIDAVTSHLSIAITNAVWLLNPHVIIIGGAYNIFGALFIDKIKEKMTDRFPEFFDELQIILSHYDENSALVGAGSIVREQWLNNFSFGNAQ